MDRAIQQWSSSAQLPPENLAELRRILGKSYVQYGDMLLLPSTILDNRVWQDTWRRVGERSMQDLFVSICKCMKLTHVAVNQPIPLALDTTTEPLSGQQNVLRSPVNFKPLYGDFGPADAAALPTDEDYTRAYWVTARQNGISQTWAPRWTMFSRGNISEKARLLDLPSVTRAVEEGACTAIDLYAGIGYFAFSYLKAGVSQVLCWELNPWSCEGLRRGAESNRWSHRTVDLEAEGLASDIAMGAERIVVFQESNEFSLERLRFITNLAPVRHVNCGLLPSSRASWQIAFAALDSSLGGWIHVHENFGLVEIKAKAEEVRQAFQQMLTARLGHPKVTAVLEGIHRVKSYAPGVWHCVVDIFVPPANYHGR